MRDNAKRIDHQRSEVRHQSWTQKLKLYNMSLFSKTIIMWLLVELYFVSHFTNTNFLFIDRNYS